MDKFYIDARNGEFFLRYHLSDRVFFILKFKRDKYYTSQLDEYKPIKEQLKDWLITELENGDIKESYDNSLIKSMFRDLKLKKLLKDK